MAPSGDTDGAQRCRRRRDASRRRRDVATPSRTGQWDGRWCHLATRTARRRDVTVNRPLPSRTIRRPVAPSGERGRGRRVTSPACTGDTRSSVATSGSGTTTGRSDRSRGMLVHVMIRAQTRGTRGVPRRRTGGKVKRERQTAAQPQYGVAIDVTHALFQLQYPTSR